MYLKSLEIIGFKSFAGKTRLLFEPGMTAIVGPNGCGKSNIADAVRWVLGEQSAKALRGAKMQDVIFSGTDTHKPMGMAEVSLTLTDCEVALGTEYHEVTITRRVLGSGEGQYYINRTPCRLKDIQRLFMDTGIGTSSYSLMEQGRIDQILSSRPDDRRAVFEEASGITKFKADRKEALRKLDHTEANLLRLDDIIREVRRQIISLQRQAGKARRYQTMQEMLRAYDIYLTRERLKGLDLRIRDLETSLSGVREQEEAAREECHEIEASTTAAREAVAATEQQINDAMEAASGARSRLDRARELIRINEDRILELHALSERDSRDAQEATGRLAQHRETLDTLVADCAAATRVRDAAQGDFNTHQASLLALENQVEKSGTGLHNLRTELVDLESRAANLQNELADLDAQERTTVIRRERLAAEQGELQRAVEQFSDRRALMDQRLQALVATRQAMTDQLDTLIARQRELDQLAAAQRQELGEKRSLAAAKDAQIDMLERSTAQAEGFPGGARLLLDAGAGLALDDGLVLGSLAEQIEAPEDCRAALESVLRAWLDAVVVRDGEAARQVMALLEERAAGSARLLPVESSGPPPALDDAPGSPRLIDRIRCSEAARPLVHRLLDRVYLVDRLDDIPVEIPARAIYVTTGGTLHRGDGSAELWMPEAKESNPLARQQMLTEWQKERQALHQEIGARKGAVEQLQAQAGELAGEIEAARGSLQEARHQVAVCEGEGQVVRQEADQAAGRLETVRFELTSLNQRDTTVETRRNEIVAALAQIRARQEEARTTIARGTESLRRLEQERSALYASVTEHRVRFAESRQQVEHLDSQKHSLQARVVELETLIRERTQGIDSYQARVAELTAARDQAGQSLAPLETELNNHQAALDSARSTRQGHMQQLGELDGRLREKRGYLESLMNRRSQQDVELAQQQMRRQNQVERIAADYHITVDQVMAQPEPEWEGGVVPDLDTLDTTVGELRTKLDAMGPVNLVAIDEHRELEERYAFLTQQQDDLVKGKQQLLEMIRQINKTTTELFSTTFNQVNENFQEMFKRIFGGGTAKLVLIDEEDVLESGIEIIARPPGKKLQTVSLLSGGERTMTAVALLFSLYMVKPSAFCMLDELDAALDEANIGRFVDVVKGFLDRSQFIVITHNRKTIAASDTLYGVTMQERGISSVMSVKFSEYDQAGSKLPTGEPATT